LARLTDIAELAAAWRALGDTEDRADGWSTIVVASDLPIRVRAGRHFPGNEEALLVGFGANDLASSTKLPEGRGFSVSLVTLPEGGDGISWVSLSRLGAGTLEMFSAMSVDILNSLASLPHTSEGQLIHSFLARIATWQYFMERSSTSILDVEAEIGLFGELALLNALLDHGIEQNSAVDSWRGPLGSIRDFELANISIEVKATISRSTFPAVISSFEQLDDSIGRHLFLAAIRLESGPSGSTLPELILRTAARLNQSALERFQALVLRAGFLAALSDQYERRIKTLECTLLPVTSEFPRLIRSHLPPAILHGRYVVDLDLVTWRCNLESALRKRS
jgi:hypothetical protein